MKNKLLVLVLLGLWFFPALSLAQVKKQSPALPFKTYWCAQVEDILVNPKEFSAADNINVGVRIKLCSQTYTPGIPGVKLCNCAVEPKRVATDFYQVVMSLRLIGLKYSETETNLLEYYGPTPVHPIYNYSGFPVISFMVTSDDIKKGYKVIWGWSPKKNPLKDNRKFTIYASLDTKGYQMKRDDDPDYLENGCFPPHDAGYEGDFRKTFKPKELKIPEIDIEKIKKGIKAPNLPDLEIAGLETSWKHSSKENEQAVAYQDFTMEISVKNSGNRDFSAFKILVERKWEWENDYSRPENFSEWVCEGKWGTIKDGIIEIDNLKAGKTKVIFVVADNSSAPRSDCWFRIILDPNKEIAEWNEDNNSMSEILFPSYYIHPEKY